VCHDSVLKVVVGLDGYQVQRRKCLCFSSGVKIFCHHRI